MKHERNSKSRNRLIAVVSSALLLASQCFPVQAQESLPQNLNLGSTRRTAQAPESLSSPVTIVNGGRERNVEAGMRLTPAQAMAVAQVLESGTQTLTLGARGNAVGGSLDLTGVQNLSSMTVPRNVSVIRDFGPTSALALSGNLVNSGSIFALSTNPAVTNAIVSANTIRNNAGALITSVAQDAVSGLAGLVSNLGLSLIATDSIFNAGTIRSAANLNLVAGNQIVNAASSASNQAVISALSNINMAAQGIVNGGLVQSGNNINVAQQLIRNVELSALAAQLPGLQTELSSLYDVRNLIVNNIGGALEALTGSIVVDHANAVNESAVVIAGGDLRSQTVTVDAGQGKLSINVGELTGVLNAKACTANIGSTSSNLTLGDIHITGDPTFYSLGDILITEQIEADSQINILVKEDILMDNVDINSRLTGSQASNVVLIAGAELLVSDPLAPQFDDPIILGQSVKVTGPSATGGVIVFGGSVINADSSVGNGGSVFLAAFHGLNSPGSGGQIVGVNVTTASLTGQAGNLTIIAPNLIDLNQALLDGKVGSPNLTVTSAQPKGTLTALSTGVTKGSLTPGAVPNTSNIVVSDFISAAAGSISLSTRGAVQVNGSINADGTNLFVSGGSPGRAGGRISLTGKEVVIGDLISADGAAGATGGAPGSAGGAGGKGGSITISATAGNITDLAGGGLSAAGGSGGAGIDGASGVASKPAGGAGGKGGAGGAGGQITLSTALAVDGVLFDNATVLSVAGGGGGEGGDGGDGFSIGVFDNVLGAGGKGGNGGKAAKAGSISMEASFITLTGSLNAVGGIGGKGGNGGDGGDFNIGAGAGATGGSAGKSGKSAAGGRVTLSATGSVSLDPIDVSGGGGAAGAAGGPGGESVSGTGGKGGKGSAASAGGKGGTLSVSSTSGSVTATDSLFALGGSSAVGGAGGAGGAGGISSLRGGDGGAGGAGGAAGKGGKITISAPVNVEAAFAISSSGSDGGQGGAGGAGGASAPGVGGDGGNGGKGGKGGSGGSIIITQPNDLNQPPTANFGAGGDGGAGGAAGIGAEDGDSGDSGAEGADGKPGSVNVSADATWFFTQHERGRSKGSKRKRTAIAEARSNSGLAHSEYRPVGFASPVLTQKPDYPSMSGLFFAPKDESLILHAGTAEVRIAKKSAAVIARSANAMAVMGLHESATGDLRVLLGHQEIRLRAGEQLVITAADLLTFAEANPLADVASRCIKEYRLLDGRRAFLCQFSISSALAQLQPLRALAESGEAYDQALLNKIVKNAAIWQTVSAHKGAYKQYKSVFCRSGAI